MLNPPDGLVAVPSFDGRAFNAVSITVALKQDKKKLGSDKTIKSIVEETLRNAATQDVKLSEGEVDLALKIQAKVFDTTPEVVARAIREWLTRAKDPYDLGLGALLDRKYKQAVELLTTSYEIRKKGNEEFLDAAFFLGNALYEAGRYKAAVEKFKEVMLFRKDDPAVLSQLALSLSYAGKYDEAEPVYKRALASSEQEFGKGHPNTALILNNLGVLYRLQRRNAEAEQLYLEALAINRRVLGNEHPMTANTLNNLAQLFRQQGRYLEAEPLYKEALVIREKKLGRDHPDTAITIDNLGLLYFLEGRLDEAEPLLKEALSVKERTLGPEHPITANSYNNVGNLFSAQGKYSEAIPLLEKALAIRDRDDLYNANPLKSTSLNNIGVAYHKQQKYVEAEPYYTRAISICEKPGLDDCDMVYRNLAKLYTTQGKYVEAEPLFKRALAIFEAKPEKERVRIVFVLESYAELLRKTNRESEAINLETRAKEIRDKAKFYGKN